MLAATAYVRLAWWLARRWGHPGSSNLACRDRHLCPRRGGRSGSIVTRRADAAASFTPRSEAALLVSILAAPALRLATLSVRRRPVRRASGPTTFDPAVGVLAHVCGAGLVFAELSVVTFLLLPWASRRDRFIHLPAPVRAVRAALGTWHPRNVRRVLRVRAREMR
jgi:hypothetical protein